MKNNFIIKKIIYLLVFVLILFFNYSVAANTIKEDYNLSDNINELEATFANNNYEEEKIIKYDATTGKSTVVDVDKLKKNKNILDVLDSVSTNYTPAYNPSQSLFLDRNNQTSIRGIFDPDLIKVNDTSVFPYRVTCRMIINGGIEYGSGFLVGPNIMLTAAHTIYDENNDNEVRNFMVYPGYNNGSYNNYSSGWQAIYRSSIWLETHDREYDWALVELKEDLGNSLGWYGTRTYSSDSSLENVSVNLKGYPASLDSGRCQYYVNGKIDDVYTRHFICSVGNLGGMSGGPIALSSDNYVVGLISANITGGLKDNTYGVKLNSYLMDVIASYINNN